MHCLKFCMYKIFLSNILKYFNKIAKNKKFVSVYSEYRLELIGKS